MNTCHRCGSEYKPYFKKLKYGVVSNGIIFGVGYTKKVYNREVNTFKRKDKYIPLCEDCLNDIINYIEILNDMRRKEKKHES